MNGWSAFTKEKNLPEEEQSRINERKKDDTTIEKKLAEAIPMKEKVTAAEGSKEKKSFVSELGKGVGNLANIVLNPLGSGVRKIKPMKGLKPKWTNKDINKPK